MRWMLGIKMQQFETNMTFEDPDLAKYNRRNNKIAEANEKAKFSYYIKEITEMTKR